MRHTLSPTPAPLKNRLTRSHPLVNYKCLKLLERERGGGGRGGTAHHPPPTLLLLLLLLLQPSPVGPETPDGSRGPGLGPVGRGAMVGEEPESSAQPRATHSPTGGPGGAFYNHPSGGRPGLSYAHLGRFTLKLICNPELTNAVETHTYTLVCTDYGDSIVL